MAREELQLVLGAEAAADVAPVGAPVPTKGRSLGTSRLTAAERAELAKLEANPKVRRLRVLRPQTRGDCKDGSANFPGRQLEELADTCSLDVADRGRQDLAVVG